MTLYSVTKTYGHERGLSCTFRQWRAKSHCRFLHGYALAFSFVFEARELDSNGWVVDFGAMSPLKKQLEYVFDHKWLVAKDDPQLAAIKQFADDGAANVHVMPAVGCEAFASHGLSMAGAWLINSGQANRVYPRSCTVAEHSGNSATAYQTNFWPPDGYMNALERFDKGGM